VAASKTALQIAQAVVGELGLPRIVSIFINPGTTERQIAALMNAEGDELFQSAQWTASQTLAVINIANPIITTGDVVAGSAAIINIPSTAGLTANLFAVTGNGLITSARVLSVDSPTSITMDEPATASGTGVALVFAKDTYAIPADFGWFLNRTMWDRTNQWELIGPISPQTDEWQRSGVVTTGPRRRWRQVGLPPNCWRLWPPPTASGSAPATLIFEYESNGWALSAAGVRQTQFLTDADTTVIDPVAIIKGVKWRLWQAKGFQYGALQAEYNDYVARLSARDGGAPDLTMARRRSGDNYLLTPDSVPDGFWPGDPGP
jgi:hypothetical protein